MNIVSKRTGTQGRKNLHVNQNRIPDNYENNVIDDSDEEVLG